MSSLIFQAPAKVNLSLRVLGKRADGFHAIDTLMVRLPGLCDEISIGDESGFAFSCDDPSVPSNESNLVVKAIRLFEEQTAIEFRRPVFLKKRIPHGAGLGGGSSDAATALRAMREISGLALADEFLLKLAVEIGSDVPFFLMDEMVRCTGRGEVLAAAGPAPSWPVVLLKSQFEVATPDAYRRWNGSRFLPGIRFDSQQCDGIELVNDLERPVFQKHRVLAEIKEWLLDRDETRAALMCGSGSTLFAVLTDPSAGASLIAAAKREIDPGVWAWAGRIG